MNDRLSIMRHDDRMLIVKKKLKVSIPKDLNVTHAWNIIAPIVAREIGVPDYTPVPNFFYTNAYQIGRIFIPTSTQIITIAQGDNPYYFYSFHELFRHFLRNR